MVASADWGQLGLERHSTTEDLGRARAAAGATGWQRPQSVPGAVYVIKASNGHYGQWGQGASLAVAQ